MTLTARPHEMAFLRRHTDSPVVKVISGVRGCGKSALLSLYREELLADGVPADRIIRLNFEDPAHEDLTECHALSRYLTSRLRAGSLNYVFLEEIQHVPHFEKAVDSLLQMGNADICITGSNGRFMSSEPAALLSGRYAELRMFPLSFSEFCSGMKNTGLSLSRKYAEYLRAGSFPRLAASHRDDMEIWEYLEGLYSTIIVKDTLPRIRSGDTALLEKIMKYMAANTGSLLSPNKIAGDLTDSGRRTDNKTVEKFLGGLKDSLLLCQADRFDIRGGKRLKTNSRYYFADPAFRRLFIRGAEKDAGHVLENLIYLELLRRGCRVYVGQIPGGEVDFVAETPDGIAYFQVCLSTLDPQVLERELKPLQSIPDQYPKFLLTLDEITPEANYGGIRKQNALEWMLSD